MSARLGTADNIEFVTEGGETVVGGAVNPVPKMAIRNNGNVGSDTAKPQARLDVNGVVHVQPGGDIRNIPAESFAWMGRTL